MMIAPQGQKRPRDDLEYDGGWTTPQAPMPAQGGGGISNGTQGGYQGGPGAGGRGGGGVMAGGAPIEGFKPRKRTATEKYEVTLLVPSSALALLIGKQHKEMQELSNKSGTRIRVQDIQDVVEGSFERGITLEGPWESVLAAQNAILEKLKNRHDSMIKDYGIDDGLESGPDPIQMYRWLIPAELCGLLIGKRGQGLQSITNETGTKCRVSNEEEMPPRCPDRIVYIVGKADQRERALRMIQQRCGGRPLDNPKAFQVQVPVKTVGYIMGHKGDHVRQIREQAGTRIKIRDISETETGVGTIKIELEGTPAQIEAAKGLLKARVISWKDNEINTHMLGLRREDIDLEKEIAMRFAMHRALVGHLVGKGGSIIRDIMTSTGTLIKVLQQEDRSHTRSSDQRPVLVVGTIPSCLDAQKRILDQLATAPPALLAQIQAIENRGGPPGFGQQPPFGQPYGYQEGPPPPQHFPPGNPGGDFPNYGLASYGYGPHGGPPPEAVGMGGLGGPPMGQGPPRIHPQGPAMGAGHQPYGSLSSGPGPATAAAALAGQHMVPPHANVHQQQQHTQPQASPYGMYAQHQQQPQQQQQVPPAQQYPVLGDQSGAQAYGYGAANPYSQQQPQQQATQAAVGAYGGTLGGGDASNPAGVGSAAAYGGSSGYPPARPPQQYQQQQASTPGSAPYPPVQGYGAPQQQQQPQQAAPVSYYGAPTTQQTPHPQQQHQQQQGYSQYRIAY